MINIKAFLKSPINFKDKCMIYPPTVAEVINSDFSLYYSLLTMTEDDILEYLKDSDIDKKPTPFEFLMANCYINKDYEERVKKAFEFFIHSTVTFLYSSLEIIIGNLNEVILNTDNIQNVKIITQKDFFDFQNLIRESVGRKPINPPVAPDPNEDPRIRRIKEKARLRDRILEKKGRAGGINFESSLVAICCMGIGITPLNIGEMSYASINPIISMMQDKEKYDIDIRSLLAGADSKKIKPVYWIKNI